MHVSLLHTNDKIFGVPGDFNLALLDHIYNVEGIRWAGNTNELNAGYAADGYSRLKRLACLITTFGVGELSALAAIAGSYAEHVGLVHVVGIPSMSAQNKHLLLHHTLGNGDFTVFKSMSGRISQNAIVITDISTAAEQIDKAIRVAYVYQRPVYLAIPANMSDYLLDGNLLNEKISLVLEPNPPEAEAEVIEVITEMVLKADHPIILVDACASRHGVIDQTAEFAKVTQFPVFVTPMGKGAFDEHNERFGGVYVGSLTDPEVANVVEHADLILSVGAMLSDFNTGSFTYHYSTGNIVEFHSDYTRIRNATYKNVKMQLFLSKLAKRLSTLPAKKPCSVPARIKFENIPPETPLKHQYLWSRLSGFLQKGDIIVSETGTSSFGIVQSQFPENAIGISQVLWGSIGYSVGAVVGAAFAAAEIDPTRRVILFVGDGSLQLTVTEISTLVRWGLKPYLFILNNDGYTIERLIRGEKAGYNDVHMWKYSKLLDVFNAKDYDAIQVSTAGELDNLFNDEKFQVPSKIRTIEVFLPQLDAPANLVKQAQITAQTNVD